MAEVLPLRSLSGSALGELDLVRFGDLGFFALLGSSFIFFWTCFLSGCFEDIFFAIAPNKVNTIIGSMLI